MIRFDLYHNLWIQINTDNNSYLKSLHKEFSYHVPNYQFMPRFKAGVWDGKICLINLGNRTIPFGLFTRLYKFTKENFDDEIIVSDDVKNVYSTDNIEIKYDLNLKPRSYQEESIKLLLSYGKGIIRLCTGSGKSLVIAYLCKILKDNNKTNQSLIIVPTVSLVQQFYSDMLDYGISEEWLGMVDKDHKEFDKNIVISTWQSLQNNKDELDRFDCVIVDECHGLKADVITGILKKCPARYRFACTGTMPNHKLEYSQVQSFIGPVLYDLGASELAKMGYLSECKINKINVDYNSKIIGDYNTIKDTVLSNSWRIELLKNIILKCDGSILMLVSKVESEGEFLLHKLRQFPELENRDIVFLSGRDEANDREKWRKLMDKKKNVIMIATYPIFSTGINIKTLKNLIFASPLKSKIKVLQSIGRTLRKHISKEHAIIYDICDNCKYLKSHAKARQKYYDKESFEVIESNITEGDSF